MRLRSRLIFFPWTCLVTSAQFVEKDDSLSSIELKKISVKNQLSIFVWVYFRVLFFVPLIWESILLPAPHSLDYCSDVINPEIR